jgi:glycosyltransferase involved in cell wall biosynthesis
MPAEVLVIDQGACALDTGLGGEFARRGVRLRHVHTATSGVSLARNLGVELSVGDLVAFIDDDCVPQPEWLASLLEAWAPNVAGVTGRVLASDVEGNKVVAISLRESTEPRLYRGAELQSAWEVGTGGNLLLRRAAIHRIGGFDESLGPGAPGRAAEDVDVLHRLLQAGCDIAYEPRAVVYHDRKTRAAWVRSRLPYGYGIGAFLASCATRGDSAVPGLLIRYLRLQAHKFVRGLASLTPWDIADSVLTTVGALAGFLWWLLRAARGRPTHVSR